MKDFRKYKKNRLTLEPGGHNICFEYENGEKTKHVNIKCVSAYKRTMERVKQSVVINVIYDTSLTIQKTAPKPELDQDLQDFLRDVFEDDDDIDYKTDSDERYKFYRKYYKLD